MRDALRDEVVARAGGKRLAREDDASLRIFGKAGEFTSSVSVLSEFVLEASVSRSSAGDADPSFIVWPDTGTGKRADETNAQAYRASQKGSANQKRNGAELKPRLFRARRAGLLDTRHPR